jgi:ankyrin repeat protein
MGRTALHYAALEGSVDQVSALIAEGLSVAATDEQGFTPLHFACQQSRDAVVEMLLDAGAPVDPVDAWGNTPLFRAVFNAAGDPTIVRRLVAAGADPDLANNSGQSPRGLTEIIGDRDTSGYFEPPT